MHARVLAAICVLMAIVTVAQSRRWFSRDVDCWITQKKVPATWESAQRRCQRYGAILASPLNTELLDYMQTLISVHNHSAPYFIGVRAVRSSENQEMQYVSVEGKQLNDMPRAVYDAIEKLDLEKGECLSMDRNGIGAVSCWDHLPYICYSNETEKCGLAPMTTTSKALTSTVVPPPGYTYNLATGSYYKFHEKMVSWDVANATCASEGAYLVVLNDAEEMNALASVQGYFYGTWVGLRDKRPGGYTHWRTVRGEPLSKVFNSWVADRPFKTGTYNCAFFFEENKLLYDEPCYCEYYFTCEISQ